MNVGERSNEFPTEILSGWVVSGQSGVAKETFSKQSSLVTLRLTAFFMWQEQDNQLTRDFRFADFNEAFAFMTRVALAAEKLDHHPWWSNVYNQVTIRLSTHDAGNVVTDKDRRLAALIDGFV